MKWENSFKTAVLLKDINMFTDAITLIQKNTVQQNDDEFSRIIEIIKYQNDILIHSIKKQKVPTNNRRVRRKKIFW